MWPHVSPSNPEYPKIKRTRKRVALGAAAAALAVTLVGSFEGLRTKTYRDPIGIPTYCFGETENAQMGRTYTVQQCRELLAGRLEEFNAMVDNCIHVPMSDKRRVAVLSFTYNVGGGALCKSNFARRLNAGDPHACDELLKWDKAGGHTLPGLTRRRKEERALCQSS